jgi:hypothetical protein
VCTPASPPGPSPVTRWGPGDTGVPK